MVYSVFSYMTPKKNKNCWKILLLFIVIFLGYGYTSNAQIPLGWDDGTSTFIPTPLDSILDVQREFPPDTKVYHGWGNGNPDMSGFPEDVTILHIVWNLAFSDAIVLSCNNDNFAFYSYSDNNISPRGSVSLNQHCINTSITFSSGDGHGDVYIWYTIGTPSMPLSDTHFILIAGFFISFCSMIFIISLFKRKI